MRERGFSVVFSPAAVRDVESLEATEAIRVVEDVKTYLEVRPIPIGKSRVKRLTGFKPPLYRIRTGDFRAYYRISGRDVVVLAVTRRKDSGKRLKRLMEEPRTYRRAGSTRRGAAE
jgi:mRNA-degrading endonuclease RelE of RelBE toxin-antitoxin system